MPYIIFLLLSFNLFASTLHLATSANPSRLNPILATDSSSSEIAGNIFNGLVKYDKDYSTIIGDLADEFHYENNTTLVFKLKKNVTWHDGEKFTSKDVLFTYDTLVSPTIVSPYSANFRFVENVEIIDDYTLKVKYKNLNIK